MPAETTLERVLTAEFEGGVVDVTIAEDEEVPGVLLVFVDSTPRRAVRVIVDDRERVNAQAGRR